MSVKINIDYVDLSDEEKAVLEEDVELINNERYLLIPEDIHDLWFTLDALLKINSKRMFDMLLKAHIRQAVHRDNLITTRLTHALRLGE